MSTVLNNLPNLRISSNLASYQPENVGPAMPPDQILWSRLSEINGFNCWLMGVRSINSDDPVDVSRGYSCGFEGNFGQGQLEVLIWDPKNRFDCLLSTPGLRIALSLTLMTESGTSYVILSGEWELSGWRRALFPWYRLRVNRDFNAMAKSLEQLIGP
ncbi:MAG: hypothetical protein AB8B95_04755 [Pseudohongiellaceae bacterium]